MMERLKKRIHAIRMVIRNPNLLDEYKSALKTSSNYYHETERNLKELQMKFEDTNGELQFYKQMSLEGISIGQKYYDKEIDIGVLLEHPHDLEKQSTVYRQTAVGFVTIKGFYTDGVVNMIETDVGKIRADRFMDRKSLGMLAVPGEDQKTDIMAAPSAASLTSRMMAAGFSPINVPGFSDDFLMWRDNNTGKTFGMDGWEMVKGFLNELDQNNVIGMLIYPSGESRCFRDADQYLKEYREEMDCRGPNGVTAKTITDDPTVRKAVDDLIYNEFGEENPHKIDYYNALQKQTSQPGQTPDMDMEL